MYPNEIASDFAFMPFGGGPRKCVGDQFAMLEAAVTMAIILKNYNFDFAIPPEDVGMKTGATIHTMNGLMMRARKAEESDIGSDLEQNEEGSSWWEMQHLKRGLNAQGRPYESEEEATRQTAERLQKQENNGGCPMA